MLDLSVFMIVLVVVKLEIGVGDVQLGGYAPSLVRAQSRCISLAAA